MRCGVYLIWRLFARSKYGGMTKSFYLQRIRLHDGQLQGMSKFPTGKTHVLMRKEGAHNFLNEPISYIDSFFEFGG